MGHLASLHRGPSLVIGTGAVHRVCACRARVRVLLGWGWRGRGVRAGVLDCIAERIAETTSLAPSKPCEGLITRCCSAVHDALIDLLAVSLLQAALKLLQVKHLGSGLLFRGLPQHGSAVGIARTATANTAAAELFDGVEEGGGDSGRRLRRVSQGVDCRLCVEVLDGVSATREVQVVHQHCQGWKGH